MKVNNTIVYYNNLPLRNSNTMSFKAMPKTMLTDVCDFIPPKNSAGFFNKIINYFTYSKTNLTNKILKKYDDLVAIGLSKKEIKSILLYIKKESNNRQTFSQILDTINLNVLDSQNPQSYIKNRIKASLDSETKNFNMDLFNLYNEFYPKFVQNMPFDYGALTFIVNNCYDKQNKCVNSEYKSYIDKYVSVVPAKELEKDLFSLNMLQGDLTTRDLDELRVLKVPNVYNIVYLLQKNIKQTLPIFKNLYKSCSNQTSVNSLCSYSQLCMNKNNFAPDIYKFIEENINDKDLYYYLRLCKASDGNSIDLEKINRYKILKPVFIEEDVLKTILNDNDINIESLQKLINLRNLAIENTKNIDDCDIDVELFPKYRNTLESLELLGEKNFTYIIKNDWDNINKYINISEINRFIKFNPQNLIEIINPENSDKYKQLSSEIRELKSNINSIVDADELRKVYKEIADKTRQKNELRALAIKDPKDALDITLIYKSLWKEDLEKEIEPYMNPQTKEEKNKLYQILSKLIFKIWRINPSLDVQNRLDFSHCKHLPALYNSTSSFVEAFKDLVDILENNPSKSNLQIFNELEQNKDTKKQFEKLGLNYEKWSSTENDFPKLSFKTTIPYKKTNKEVEITIQKADMNDLKHSLFLGNDASCCTSVNGCNGWSANSYVTNKLISAIELKDENNFIGNTMCYFAKVNGKLSLVLDNVELKSQYQNNYKIRDSIIKYAKIICAEVGKPNLPIYAGANRQKINLSDSPKAKVDMQIIGSTGDDDIYIDSLNFNPRISDKESSKTTLYKIS